MTHSQVFDLANQPKRWTKSQKEDALLSMVALSQLLFGIIQGVLIAMGMDKDASTSYRVYMSAFSIILSVPLLLKRNFLLLIVTYAVGLVIFGIHAVIFPETMEYWTKEAFRFTFPICIPTVICVVSIRDKYVFYHILKIVTYLSGLLCIFYCARIITGAYDLGFSYNQGIGYLLLFPILVLFYQNKWYSLLFAGILFLLLLIYGSRAPLISLALFFVYVFIREKKYTFLVVLIIFIFAFTPLLTAFLESQGFSSRTLELYLSGELNTDNGRNDITNQIMRGIKQNPYGWGMFGDRVITNGETYAHNFIREVIVDFGVVFGPFILVCFFYEILKTFVKCKGADRDIFAMFSFGCLAPVFVSGSFITNMNFALFIGIMLLYAKSNKRRTKTTVNIK